MKKIESKMIRTMLQKPSALLPPPSGARGKREISKKMKIHSTAFRIKFFESPLFF